jgi:hypothetical protein
VQTEKKKLKWNPSENQFNAVTTSVRTMSEAALTLSTAPTESVRVAASVSLLGMEDPGFCFWPGEPLTALLDLCACFRKLDKDDVAEALLGIVCDGHRSDTGLIVILEHLVILRVSFRWNRGVKPTRLGTRDRTTDDSLTIVRLRVSKAEGKARRGDARWTRSTLVRLDAYRRECILVQVGRHETGQVKGAARSRDYVPTPFQLRGGNKLTPTKCIISKRILCSVQHR